MAVCAVPLTFALISSCSKVENGGNLGYDGSFEGMAATERNQSMSNSSNDANSAYPSHVAPSNPESTETFNTEGDIPGDEQTSACQGVPIRKEISFKGSQGDTVPGYLWLPPCDVPDKKYPAVLGMYGISGDKDSGTIRIIAEKLAVAGFVTLTMDWIGTGDRLPAISKTRRVTDVGIATRTVADYGKALDFLAAQPQVDADRLGYIGASMGAMTGIAFGRSESRLKGLIYFVPIINPLWGALAPEQQIRGISKPTYCFYTKVDTSDQVCKNASGSQLRLKEFSGGHELDDHIDEATSLATEFLKEIL